MVALYVDTEENVLVAVCKDRTEEIFARRAGSFYHSYGSDEYMFTLTFENVRRISAMFKDIEADEKTIAYIGDMEKKERRIKRAIDIAENPKKEVKFDVAGLKLPLRRFQRSGVKFMLRRRCGFLADSMGLGKSLSAIAYSSHLKSKGKVGSCLIIAPASVLYSWAHEIEKFTDESYTIVDGAKSKRLDKWNDDSFFKIVGYEILAADLGYVLRGREKRKASARRKSRKKEKLADGIAPKKWDVVIADEVHYIRNHDTARSAALKTIKAKYRWGLTGTPLDSRIEELHSIMEFVQNGVFPDRKTFRGKHCEFDQFNHVIGYKNMDEVRYAIRPYYIRRLKEEVSKELKGVVKKTIRVTLDAAQRKVYDKFRAEVLSGDEQGNKLVLTTRAKQICDSPELVDEMVSSAKMSLFLNIVDEFVLTGNKIVVFSQFAKMCEILKRETEARGFKVAYIHGGVSAKKRGKLVDQFSSTDTLDIMLMTEAGSCGLNLQASSAVIHYDDNWSPSVMQQRRDRCYRIGQKEVVTEVRFRCIDTIEDRIIEVLEKKMDMQSEVIKSEKVAVEMLSAVDIKKVI